MKSAIFAATTFAVLATAGAAVADTAKSVKLKVKPATMVLVLKPAKGIDLCTTPGWVPRPIELNPALGPCVPGSLTPVLPFDH